MNKTEIAKIIEKQIIYDDVNLFGDNPEKSTIFFNEEERKLVIREKKDISKYMVKLIAKQFSNKINRIVITNKKSEIDISIINENKEEKAKDYGLDYFSRKKIFVNKKDIFYTDWKKD